MIIELKNAKIGGRNFSGCKFGSTYLGKSFTVVLSEKEAKKLKDSGCLVRKMHDSDTKYVIVKIPNIKHKKMTIRAKIHDGDDLVLDYSSVNILDYVNINKANIKVSTFKPSNVDKLVLFLESMEVHIDKEVTIPVTGLMPIIDRARSQAFSECRNKLKNFVDNLEEEKLL